MTFDTSKMIQMAKALFAEERRIDRLDGWFLAKEIEMLASGKYEGLDKEIKKAHLPPSRNSVPRRSAKALSAPTRLIPLPSVTKSFVHT